MQKTSAHTPEARVSQPSAVSIPDSEGKSNSFDENSSKKVDDGSRAALRRWGSVASELAGLKAAVKKIVNSGKKSKWAKQKDNVRGVANSS